MKTESTKRVPLYLMSPEYARQNGELDDYRASNAANKACASDIEAAIKENFDGIRLSPKAAEAVLSRHSEKRVCLVLALTLRDKSWDKRFSQANMQWAQSFAVPGWMLEPDRLPSCLVTTHPAVLDGFVGQIRRQLSVS